MHINRASETHTAFKQPYNAAADRSIHFRMPCGYQPACTIYDNHYTTHVRHPKKTKTKKRNLRTNFMVSVYSEYFFAEFLSIQGLRATQKDTVCDKN